MSKHVIGLMPGVPVPRIVSVCDGNGEAWFEVRVKYRSGGKGPLIDGLVEAGYGNIYSAGSVQGRHQGRSECMDAVRAYIERTSAEKHFVLAEEAIDCVPEPA